MRSASALRFSKGCSSLNLDRMVMFDGGCFDGICFCKSWIIAGGWKVDCGLCTDNAS